MEDNYTTEASQPTITEAFRQGIQYAFKYWRVSLIYWLATLGLSMVVALPFRSTLLAETGNSMILNNLIAGFNYTYLNDFLQNYGSALTPLLNQSIVALVVQIFLLVFFAGGLTKTIVVAPERYDSRLFWGGSGYYFWRMLRLTLLFVVLHVIILLLFGWLYLTVTKGMSLANLDSEAIITSCLRWLIPLYVLVASVPMLWQDYAKLYLVKLDKTWIWSSVRESGSFVRKNFLKVYGLYLLVLVITLAVFGLNYLLQGVFVVQSVGTIIISFFLTQFLVIIRFACKVLNLGSARSLSQV